MRSGTCNTILEENNLSVRNFYSTCTDAELDELVTQIKNKMPHAGYNLVRYFEGIRTSCGIGTASKPQCTE